MSECSNCGCYVDQSTDFCPVCGKRDPSDFAANVLFAFILLLAALFLAPAIICIYPFSFSLWNATEKALTSGASWAGSSAFWGTLLLIYKSNNPRAFDMLTNLGIFMWLPLIFFSGYKLIMGVLSFF
ncbi:MAG: hypothetical protein CME33_13905 [Gimesia sp.]|uniref:hypothetical protein n=1 Tax=Gimesia sp. TaxID=2024833 RepID=UPI000C57425B|nr:hypothetical protein [Gimesia sp.]MAX37647.1 hypothetical protein [Gimesia sp.]|tara:strand:- start:16527 stop:16907 length:381 start_codon:yes stop_codon:yes gene_type:complete